MIQIPNITTQATITQQGEDWLISLGDVQQSIHLNNKLFLIAFDATNSNFYIMPLLSDKEVETISQDNWEIVGVYLNN